MNRNLVIPLLFILFVTLCVVDSKKGSKSGGQGNKNKEDIKILVPGGKKPGKDTKLDVYNWSRQFDGGPIVHEFATVSESWSWKEEIPENVIDVFTLGSKPSKDSSKPTPKVTSSKTRYYFSDSKQALAFWPSHKHQRSICIVLDVKTVFADAKVELATRNVSKAVVVADKVLGTYELTRMSDKAEKVARMALPDELLNKFCHHIDSRLYEARVIDSLPSDDELTAAGQEKVTVSSLNGSYTLVFKTPTPPSGPSGNPPK